MRDELLAAMEHEVDIEFETAGPGTAVEDLPETAPPRIDALPPWKVILHNDDVNDQREVVDAIVDLTTLSRMDALHRMIEAHTRGLSLLLTTHREHAELLEEQFMSKRLVVTIERD